MNKQFRGLGVAAVTPFLQNGEIDFDSLTQLVENLITEGVDYIVALGTTAETPTLSCEEKETVVRAIVKAVQGRVPVVMGLGSPSTQEVLNTLTHFDFTGIDAILSVTPYYNRPSQEGLYEHYSEMSYHSPLPIILYNVGMRTSCNLEAETTLKLAHDCKKIIGVKEASGNMNQIMRLINEKPEDFLVISGDDAVALPLLSIGADGLISVVANAYPRNLTQMVHLAFDNQVKEAAEIHNKMLPLIQACFKEGNPAGVKAILAIQGKIEYYLRLPLTRVSRQLQECYKELMRELQ